MAFVWIDQMSVNVKVIDEQHKYFVSLLNECYNFVMERKVESVVNVSLLKIRDYALTHFATEEKYFDLYQYENAEEHKKAHKLLVENVEKIMKERQGTTDIYNLANDLVELLERWLVDHLETMDKLYTKCFNEHGLY